MSLEDDDDLLAADEFLSKKLAAFCAVKVGRIEKYDPATRKASVKPLVKRWADREGERTQESQGQIDSVPVFMLGDDDFEITLPVKVGARCILLFSDEPLEDWLDSGEEAPASAERGHHITDCIALVGIRPFQRAMAGPAPPTDGVAIRARDGISLVVKKQSIELAGAEKSVAMAEPISEHQTAMNTWLGGLQAPPGGGAVTNPTGPPPAPPTIASSKVKVGA